MTIATKLKSCPFCGSDDIHINGYKSFWIICGACLCEGPSPSTLWPTKKAAIDAWNHRIRGNKNEH